MHYASKGLADAEILEIGSSKQGHSPTHPKPWTMWTRLTAWTWPVSPLFPTCSDSN